LGSVTAQPNQQSRLSDTCEETSPKNEFEIIADDHLLAAEAEKDILPYQASMNLHAVESERTVVKYRKSLSSDNEGKVIEEQRSEDEADEALILETTPPNHHHDNISLPRTPRKHSAEAAEGESPEGVPAKQSRLDDGGQGHISIDPEINVYDDIIDEDHVTRAEEVREVENAPMSFSHGSDSDTVPSVHDNQSDLHSAHVNDKITGTAEMHDVTGLTEEERDDFILVDMEKKRETSIEQHNRDAHPVSHAVYAEAAEKLVRDVLIAVELQQRQQQHDADLSAHPTELVTEAFEHPTGVRHENSGYQITDTAYEDFQFKSPEIECDVHKMLPIDVQADVGVNSPSPVPENIYDEPVEAALYKHHSSKSDERSNQHKLPTEGDSDDGHTSKHDAELEIPPRNVVVDEDDSLLDADTLIDIDDHTYENLPPSRSRSLDEDEHQSDNFILVDFQVDSHNTSTYAQFPDINESNLSKEEGGRIDESLYDNVPITSAHGTPLESLPSQSHGVQEPHHLGMNDEMKVSAFERDSNTPDLRDDGNLTIRSIDIAHYTNESIYEDLMEIARSNDDELVAHAHNADALHEQQPIEREQQLRVELPNVPPVVIEIFDVEGKAERAEIDDLKTAPVMHRVSTEIIEPQPDTPPPPASTETIEPAQDTALMSTKAIESETIPLRHVSTEIIEPQPETPILTAHLETTAMRRVPTDIIVPQPEYGDDNAHISAAASLNSDFLERSNVVSNGHLHGTKVDVVTTDLETPSLADVELSLPTSQNEIEMVEHAEMDLKYETTLEDEFQSLLEMKPVPYTPPSTPSFDSNPAPIFSLHRFESTENETEENLSAPDSETGDLTADDLLMTPAETYEMEIMELEGKVTTEHATVNNAERSVKVSASDDAVAADRYVVMEKMPEPLPHQQGDNLNVAPVILVDDIEPESGQTCDSIVDDLTFKSPSVHTRSFDDRFEVEFSSNIDQNKMHTVDENSFFLDPVLEQESMFVTEITELEATTRPAADVDVESQVDDVALVPNTGFDITDGILVPRADLDTTYLGTHHHAISDTLSAIDSDFTPAVDSDFTPAVDSDFTPAVDSDFTPAVDSDFTPAVDSDFTPAVDSDITPAVDSDITPAVDSDFTPAVDSDITPTVNSDITLAVDSDITPTVDSVFTPAVDSTMKPIETIASDNLLDLEATHEEDTAASFQADDIGYEDNNKSLDNEYIATAIERNSRESYTHDSNGQDAEHNGDSVADTDNNNVDNLTEFVSETTELEGKLIVPASDTSLRAILLDEQLSTEDPLHLNGDANGKFSGDDEEAELFIKIENALQNHAETEAIVPSPTTDVHYGNRDADELNIEEGKRWQLVENSQNVTDLWRLVEGVRSDYLNDLPSKAEVSVEDSPPSQLSDEELSEGLFEKIERSLVSDQQHAFREESASHNDSSSADEVIEVLVREQRKEHVHSAPAWPGYEPKDDVVQGLQPAESDVNVHKDVDDSPYSDAELADRKMAGQQHSHIFDEDDEEFMVNEPLVRRQAVIREIVLPHLGDSDEDVSKFEPPTEHTIERKMISLPSFAEDDAHDTDLDDFTSNNANKGSDDVMFKSRWKKDIFHDISPYDNFGARIGAKERPVFMLVPSTDRGVKIGNRYVYQLFEQ
jgi:hypothetical protein